MWRMQIKRSWNSLNHPMLCVGLLARRALVSISFSFRLLQCSARKKGKSATHSLRSPTKGKKIVRAALDAIGWCCTWATYTYLPPLPTTTTTTKCFCFHFSPIECDRTFVAFYYTHRPAPITHACECKQNHVEIFSPILPFFAVASSACEEQWIRCRCVHAHFCRLCWRGGAILSFSHFCIRMALRPVGMIIVQQRHSFSSTIFRKCPKKKEKCPGNLTVFCLVFDTNNQMRS